MNIRESSIAEAVCADHADGDAMHWAAYFGHTDRVRMLLAAGVSANANRGSALLVASANGHPDVVSALIADGVDIHVDRDTALRWAAATGHIEVVRILLGAGADPVIAYRDSDVEDRRLVVATLDACCDALTAEHGAVIIAGSEPDEFVKLRAAVKSVQMNRTLHR